MPKFRQSKLGYASSRSSEFWHDKFVLDNNALSRDDIGFDYQQILMPIAIKYCQIDIKHDFSKIHVFNVAYKSV